MSDSHKAALAEGREQGRAVRRYLEALEATGRSGAQAHAGVDGASGSQPSTRSCNAADPSPGCTSSRSESNLQAELSSTDNAVDLGAFEEDFVVAARSYGEAQGHHLRRLAAGWASPPGVLAQGRHQAGRR